LHAMILRAMRAILLRGARRTTCLARAQILQGSLQLARQRLEAGDGLLRLQELRLKGLAHDGHGFGTVAAALPCLEERLDLVEREPGLLKELDPPDPRDCRLIVEAESAGAARDRMEQIQLFVEPKRPNGLPRLLREITDLEMFAIHSFHRLPPRDILPLRERQSLRKSSVASAGWDRDFSRWPRDSRTYMLPIT